jgi:hypothetical protein
MIEECRSCWYLCKNEDHTLQYVVLSNDFRLILFFLLLVPWLLLVLWISMQYALVLLDWYYWCCYFLILREVLLLLLCYLKTPDYQFQDGVKHPRLYRHFSFLVDTQILLHILQGVKVSTKRGMKCLLLIHWRYCSYDL